MVRRRGGGNERSREDQKCCFGATGLRSAKMNSVRGVSACSFLVRGRQAGLGPRGKKPGPID